MKHALHPSALALALAAVALVGCDTGATSGGDRLDAGRKDGGGGSPVDAGNPLTPDGKLTGVVRDFKMRNPVDFENELFSNPSVDRDDRGIVAATLGADGTPTYAGPGSASPSTTSGATNFHAWFHDVEGVNQKADFTIQLVKGAGDVWTYDNQSFFPVDGQLYGNQDCVELFGAQTCGAHNFSFTYELHTVFTYRGGESFKFTGDDDLWVFIDKKLVIDLGGIHVPETGSVDLDTLGLKAGSPYSLDLFFAERHQSGSHFRIDTSLVLSTEPN